MLWRTLVGGQQLTVLEDSKLLGRFELAAADHVQAAFPEEEPAPDVIAWLLVDAFLLAQISGDLEESSVLKSIHQLGKELECMAVRKFLAAWEQYPRGRFMSPLEHDLTEKKERIQALWAEAGKEDRLRMSLLHRMNDGSAKRPNGVGASKLPGNELELVDVLRKDRELDDEAIERVLTRRYSPILGRIVPSVDREEWTSRVARNMERYRGVFIEDLVGDPALRFGPEIFELAGAATNRMIKNRVKEEIEFLRGPGRESDLRAVIAGRWQAFGDPLPVIYMEGLTPLEYLLDVCLVVPGHLRIVRMLGEVLGFVAVLPLSEGTFGKYARNQLGVYKMHLDPSAYFSDKPRSVFIMNFINLAEEQRQFRPYAIASLLSVIGDVAVQWLSREQPGSIVATGFNSRGFNILRDHHWPVFPNEYGKPFFCRHLSSDDWDILERAQLS